MHEQESEPGRSRLLIVEDDGQLAGMLAELLTREGYEVDVALDGHRGLHLGLSRSYRVMIIDRRLPVVEGLDLVARLRRRAVASRMLILTALGDHAERVRGLDAGADDYLPKPFDLDELMARVRALDRRFADHAELLPVGAGHLDVELRDVTLPDGRRVALSPREFHLLFALASRPKTIYSRAQLRQQVFTDTEAESIVDTYVYYLRRKLGRQVVRTVRGFGYQIGLL